MKPKTTTMKEKIAGINEIKHIFFEKANNINKCLARLSTKKKGTQKLPISEMEEEISLKIPQTL